MGQRPLHNCNRVGCSELTRNKYCDKHIAEKPKQKPKKETSNEAGYTYRWQKQRLLYLKQNPICVICEWNGMITPATEVDHIIPHKKDWQVFWDVDNWESLCKRCHAIKTFTEIKTGYIPLKVFYPTIRNKPNNVIVVCGNIIKIKEYIKENKTSNDIELYIYIFEQDREKLLIKLQERNKMLRELYKRECDKIYIGIHEAKQLDIKYWTEQFNIIDIVIV